MKFLLSISLLLAATVDIDVDAFVVPPSARGSSSTTATTVVLHSSSTATTTTTTTTLDDDKFRIKKAGGGVAVVPSGDRESFWNPAVEGMRGMDGDLSLDERLARGIEFAMQDTSTSTTTTASSSSFPIAMAAMDAPVPQMLHAAQCWLEHLDEDPNNPVPPTFATPKSPVVATVLGRTKLIDDDAPGDIQHVVLKLPQGFHYVEGQSLSVIPPGFDAKGKKQKPRLYSIASTRYGDLLDGTTVSLCVRRAEYYDPGTGNPDPTKAGACSKFLCDATPGMQVNVAGPVGKTMVLPKDPTKDIIMVATGTGIAPFRSFLHRLYIEQTPANHLKQGNAWLILGVPTTGSLLYKPEFDSMMRNDSNDGNSNKSESSLRIDYAISREMSNAQGGKLYVQDVLKQNSAELFSKLENGAVIYFCGLKGMMPGILEALEEVATSNGIDWTSTLKRYQTNHQWHVEVY